MTQVAHWSGTRGAGIVDVLPDNWEQAQQEVSRRTTHPTRTLEVTGVLVARAYGYFVEQIGDDVRMELNKLTIEELVQLFLDC